VLLLIVAAHFPPWPLQNTGRDPFVIMGLAPGVLLDRVNVGGSESGQQDIVVARGAADAQKTFNVQTGDRVFALLTLGAHRAESEQPGGRAG
jgi:hypothetical protein